MSAAVRRVRRLSSWIRGQAPGTVRDRLMRVVLLTTGLAVWVAGLAMLTQDFNGYRKSWAADLSIEAEILSLSTAPALEFDDFEVAQRNLAALQARPQLLAAALYSAGGTLYASYVRPGEPPPPKRAPLPGLRMSGDGVDFAQPVERKGEALGTIYLRARYDLWNRLATYLGIFVIVTLLSLAIAFLFASQLQEGITAPLDGMAGVAREIVSRRDYSLRARKTADDEIGVVVDAFNKMLEEIEARSAALERTNRVLEEEVAVRKSTEAALRSSEKLYRAIGESIDYGVWVCDPDGHNRYASESFLRLIGMTQQQVSDFGWVQALHPEDAAATLEAWRECVRAGTVWYRQHRMLGIDGTYHPILAQGVPIRDEAGTITGWAGINLDISRLKRTEEALREADRRKDEFLATLAHELRNPLAPIRHAVRLLESRSISERQQQWARDVISRQVQRMALLLDDLLDVSRITRGRLNLKLERVSLASLVEAAVETARPLIEARQHQLNVELPSVPLSLAVDPLRISQALSNLLTNAAKYTDARGRIALTVDLGPEALSFCVKDTGIGFEPGAMANMFEMFSQLDPAIDRAEGGLGIGLALVKGLIELHGGSVEAHSPGLGLGSEFIIRLPRSVVSERPELPRIDDEPAMGAPMQLKVLVVDDNRDAAESLGMVLELSGHEVRVANSGRQALALAREDPPDVLILDIGMPDMTGYEVAREIRREPWGRGVLLLAITGWGQREDKERASAAGFDHHLTKPVDAAQVEQLLRTCRASSPVV